MIRASTQPSYLLRCSIGLLLVSASASAAPPDYTTVELQARSNLLVNDNGWNLPPGSSFNSISADINANQQVAFRVQVVPDQSDPSQSHAAIWLGGHGTGSLVYLSPIDNPIDNEACLNDHGDIAFSQSTGGIGNVLHFYDATAGSASAISTTPVIPNGYGAPCVNANRDFGFQANFSNGRAFAARIGGVSTFYATDTGITPTSSYTYLYTPSFNDAGTIAAKVATSADQFTNVEIRAFESDGTSHMILANNATDPSSPYKKFDNSIALDNNGTIAVIATRASDNRRVVVRSNGVTTVEIASVDPAGTIRTLDSFAPDINDSGLVAFRASDATGQAVYVGDGQSLVRVAGKGDVVMTDLGSAQLGQHDSSAIFSGRPSINAKGDIAFVAGVYPEGDSQTEWGSGVFVAYAGVTDWVFSDGFDS